MEVFPSSWNVTIVATSSYKSREPKTVERDEKKRFIPTTFSSSFGPGSTASTSGSRHSRESVRTRIRKRSVSRSHRRVEHEIEQAWGLHWLYELQARTLSGLSRKARNIPRGQRLLPISETTARPPRGDPTTSVLSVIFSCFPKLCARVNIFNTVSVDDATRLASHGQRTNWQPTVRSGSAAASAGLCLRGTFVCSTWNVLLQPTASRNIRLNRTLSLDLYTLGRRSQFPDPPEWEPVTGVMLTLYGLSLCRSAGFNCSRLFARLTDPSPARIGLCRV